MSKYIAVKDRKFIRLTPIESCKYVKFGWIEPSTSYYFGDWSQKHPIHEPPKLVKPMVYAIKLSLCEWANNCRVVSDEVTNEIDSIDNQIKELQVKRTSIINDNFLTFRLVQSDDLLPDTVHKRYETKSEAIRRVKQNE